MSTVPTFSTLTGATKDEQCALQEEQTLKDLDIVAPEGVPTIPPHLLAKLSQTENREVTQKSIDEKLAEAEERRKGSIISMVGSWK
ncbi:hypothetical protein DFQ26_007325 [Actinomortierella ambigua]|nr:hypothetical protein DFQ26_007325 [Actinomortierella ambigua]